MLRQTTVKKWNIIKAEEWKEEAGHGNQGQGGEGGEIEWQFEKTGVFCFALGVLGHSFLLC